MGRDLKCECGICSVCKSREQTALRRQNYPEEVRAIDRERYYRNREKRLAAMKRYAVDHKEELAANKRRWMERNPEKRRAHNIASSALRRGKIVRGTCARKREGPCQGRIEMHHRDYSKPYEVEWLCSFHHALERRK